MDGEGPRADADAKAADPMVWAAALRGADGDTSRLAVQRDGSIVVRNKPRR